MRRHMKYLGSKCKVLIAFVIPLAICICLCACVSVDDAESHAQDNNFDKEISKEEITEKAENIVDENISSEPESVLVETTVSNNIEVQAGIEDLKEVEMYSYEVEKKTFSFSVDQGEEYHIPYVRVSGLQDAELQWEINHTLWENACWIFDCAELTADLYCMFDGSNAMQITGIYKYKNYLSVVYEGVYEQSIEGHIAYAIVVDMLTGERVLMSDMVEKPNEFKELLLHYFDGDSRIMRLFITEDVADKILFLSSMTEEETVIHNIFSYDGNVSSVSYLFENASFYMTEEAFVVLPGARCYEPLYFEWDEVEGIVR